MHSFIIRLARQHQQPPADFDDFQIKAYAADGALGLEFSKGPHNPFYLFPRHYAAKWRRPL